MNILRKAWSFVKHEGKGAVAAGAMLIVILYAVRKIAAVAEAKRPGTGEQIKGLFRV